MRRNDAQPDERKSKRGEPGPPARDNMESSHLPGGRYDEGSPSAQPEGFGDFEGEQPGNGDVGETASPYEGSRDSARRPKRNIADTTPDARRTGDKGRKR